MPVAAGPAGLPGWPGERPDAALAAYRGTLDLIGPEWPRPAAGDDPAEFFATRFRAGTAQTGRLTGYFEPEIDASPVRTGRFRYPLHAPPPDLPASRPWLSRAEIDASAALDGLELAWLDDPLEAFLVHVQGAARLRFPDGRVLRLGHAAKNGHPYRSIGAELVRRGAVTAPEMSLAAIRAWCAAHPGEVAALLQTNPSYIFFAPRAVDPACGPLGAMGRPVTEDVTLAVDPAHLPLGAPVWIGPGVRGVAPGLRIAQDTGSAIRGAGRADLFCGTGGAAGARAGALNAPVTLWPLRPTGAA